jgi:hypothetical protein
MAIQGYNEAKQTKNAKRLIVSVEAQDKEGKTEFGLSAPKPLCLINQDIGLEGVIEKHVKKKEKIYVADFDYRDATSVQEQQKMWENAKKCYLDALKSPEIKTLVWDTATEGWELIRLARFGKLTQVMPHSYGPVNAEFQDLIRKAYDTDKNVIFLHKLKRQYINDKPTGVMERAGFGNIGYLVQINIRLIREMGEEGRGFGMKIINCRYDANLAGQEVWEPMSNFETLFSLIYPEE